MTNQKLLKTVAQRAVRRSGRLVYKNFHRIQQVALRTRKELVLRTDMQSEKIIINEIRRYFPEHNLLSEECGQRTQGSDYTWVIDPLDGTVNYYNGITPFRIGLCVLYRNQPTISAIYNPMKNNLYFAEKGRGAWLNQKRIRVSRRNDIHNCLIMTHLSSRKVARQLTIRQLETLFQHNMRIRLFGCGLAGLTYIAQGTLDVFYNLLTYPWDILPGALLVKEAGGKVTETNGHKLTASSTSVLATNGKFHTPILHLIRQAQVPVRFRKRVNQRIVTGETFIK